MAYRPYIEPELLDLYIPAEWFVLVSVCIWLLRGLFPYDLRLMITPLLFPNFSFKSICILKCEVHVPFI